MSTEVIPRYVLDASVATKWFLNDEENAAEADWLLQSFRDGRIDLVAPDHIRYEVPNAIRNAIRTRRVSENEGIEAVDEFFSWGIRVVAADDIIVAGMSMALRFDCALYDGVYLALAETLNSDLVYADKRLRNTRGDRFPLALWIADVTLP